LKNEFKKWGKSLSLENIVLEPTIAKFIQNIYSSQGKFIPDLYKLIITTGKSLSVCCEELIKKINIEDIINMNSPLTPLLDVIDL